LSQLNLFVFNQPNSFVWNLHESLLLTSNWAVDL